MLADRGYTNWWNITYVTATEVSYDSYTQLACGVFCKGNGAIL